VNILLSNEDRWWLSEFIVIFRRWLMTLRIDWYPLRMPLRNLCHLLKLAGTSVKSRISTEDNCCLCEFIARYWVYGCLCEVNFIYWKWLVPLWSLCNLLKLGVPLRGYFSLLKIIVAFVKSLPSTEDSWCFCEVTDIYWRWLVTCEVTDIYWR